jgi:hypothetical protein
VPHERYSLHLPIRLLLQAEHDKTYSRAALADAKAHEACVLAAMRIMEAVLQEQVNFQRRLTDAELDNYMGCFEDALLADGPNYSVCACQGSAARGPVGMGWDGMGWGSDWGVAAVHTAGAVAKFLWYGVDLELPLTAVRVLARMCESPRARQLLVCWSAARGQAIDGQVLTHAAMAPRTAAAQD